MTPDQTRALIQRLRRLQDTTRAGKMVLLPEGSVSRLDLIERRLLAAVQRALTPGPERDGYPSGHRGGGDGKPEDIDYHPDSSTQHAAFRRLDGKPKDPVLEHVQLAYRHLETAVNGIAELMVQLDYIDEKLSTPYSKHGNPGADCLVCDRHVEGTEKDKVTRGMCSTDYRQWLRSGRPDLMEFRRMRQQEAA